MNNYFIYRKDDVFQKHKILTNFKAEIDDTLKNSDIEISIKAIKETVSRKQQKYLHGVIVDMALEAMQELGNEGVSAEYVYNLLKAQGGFFEVKTIKIKDKVFKEIIFETFSLKGDKQRMKDFIDFAIRWCAENLGIVIPEPDVFGLNFKE